jgi:maltose O-acetyltransferase
VTIGLLRRILLSSQALDIWSHAQRVRMVRAGGVRLGEKVVLKPGTSIGRGRCSIGTNTFINRECLLEPAGGIVIGSNTGIGPRATILTITHELASGYPRHGPNVLATVTIGSNVWIGASATILPGASIGDGCVIAAGALVRGHLAADGLYAGVPAVRIRDLPKPGDVTGALG